jgi:hypothetical protein
VSSIVQIDAISRESMNRLSNLVTGAAQARSHGGEHQRIEIIYDEEKASMKIVLIGGLTRSVELLTLINTLAENEQ